jgi:hypothetical protein
MADNSRIGKDDPRTACIFYSEFGLAILSSYATNGTGEVISL